MIDVVRPKQPPDSLAKKKSYRGGDVLVALHEVFLGKCYLCETAVELGAFDVDHRKPKTEPGAMFDWSNLFPACAVNRCNQRRQKHYPESGLLDPAGGDQVEKRVVQRLEGCVSLTLRAGGSVGFCFTATTPVDGAAVSTAAELDRIHNGAAVQATNLRSAIVAHVCTVATHVMDYRELLLATERQPEKLELARHHLAKLVSRGAPFTMLVRSYFAKFDFVRELFD